MRVRLRPGVRLIRAGAGEYLLSERPLRAVRVGIRLAELLRPSGSAGVAGATPTEKSSLEALVARGMLERAEPPTCAEGEWPAVSVVIPVRDRARELRRCLEALWRVDYPRDRLEVVVVDDGSVDDSVLAAREAGAEVVSSGGVGRGPGAARNRGAAAARGEVLAFVDSDCVPSPSWLRELLGWFEDPAVAAVGGRVEGLRTHRWLDRYEASMSSLDLGGRERSGAGGDDTFYLPSCNLLVRKAAFQALGGFRPELHVGEDVDLSWRLRERGDRIVYAPFGAVRHEHRSLLRPFLVRRFQYGSSEGALQSLHPRRRKRIVLPPLLTASLGLLAAAILVGSPFAVSAAAVLAAADTLGFAGRLRRAGLPVGYPAVLAARARALGSLAYYVAYHLVRYYGWVMLVAAATWPRAGLLALLLFGVAAGVDWAVRRPALSPAVFAFYYGAEHLAYALGVFWGCWRQRTFSSYRPVLRGRADLPAT